MANLVMLAKPLFALSSLFLGGALMGFVVHLQGRPTLRTSTQSALVTPALEIKTPEPEVLPSEEEVMLFDAVTITASRPVRQVRKIQPARVTQLARAIEPERVEEPLIASTPCSDWRPIGPKAVVGEDGPSERHVRMLCR